uniref:Uncharacterized protein n=1 Tax=Octopus bimaculoides TaxID=37653 RepID=A0A0L8HET9_OCTBM
MNYFCLETTKQKIFFPSENYVNQGETIECGNVIGWKSFTPGGKFSMDPNRGDVKSK